MQILDLISRKRILGFNPALPGFQVNADGLTVSTFAVIGEEFLKAEAR
ncbi:hypothetical protein [Paraburkholderia sp. BR14320]